MATTIPLLSLSPIEIRDEFDEVGYCGHWPLLYMNDNKNLALTENGKMPFNGQGDHGLRVHRI